MISVLILTKNEEANLPLCLRSLDWCDDVVVLDSYSTDRTIEIAKDFGARVYQRELRNWSDHQNWAVSNIDFYHPWVYYSDADEEITSELHAELLRVANDQNSPNVAYRVRFKNQFMGKWLRWSSLYPTWVLRFFKPDKVCWEREVNPIAIVDGPEGKLKGHFLHYSFNKGFDAWFEKHNRYSRQECDEAIKSIRKNERVLPGIVSRNPVTRRMCLKALSWRLPFRPFLRFAYMYFFRLGFLDGYAGFTYCRLIAMYEFMIDLKIKEFRRREKGLPL
jgi:glycosyltransferase involved in cell wall biosynthesis